MAFQSFFGEILEFIKGVQENVSGFLESVLSPSEAVAEEPENIVEAARHAGIETDVETVRQVQTELRALLESQSEIADLARDLFVPDTLIQERPDWQLQRGYLYRVRVEGRSLLTGEAEERFYSVYTDDPMTVGDVEREIKDFLDTHAEDCDFEVESAELEDVIGRADRRR